MGIEITISDCDDIDRYLDELTDISRDRVLLMPQGTEISQLEETGKWLQKVCNERGYRFCPRLHIELFGCVRGT